MQVLPDPGKRLVVHDNHKPVFTNCSQYAPSVKEEEPVGTYVFAVKAFDRDPPEAGGTINYTFVSAPGERLRFTIDSETGVIKTRHVSASHFLECCKLVVYLQNGDGNESPGMWLQVYLGRCVTCTGKIITGRVKVRRYRKTFTIVTLAIQAPLGLKLANQCLHQRSILRSHDTIKNYYMYTKFPHKRFVKATQLIV